MRELDFSESNLLFRWLGVKGIWDLIQGEVAGGVRRRLEGFLREELRERVGCGRYERSGGRCGYRNGTYARDLLTSYGWIEGLEVPRMREGGYETEVFEKYRRRQRRLDGVLLEAFLLGHSTRKTIRLFRQAFGASVSAQTVSNVVKELDSEVKHFHRKVLRSDYRFVYLDGLWLTVSKPQRLTKVLLIAVGVKPDMTQEILSFQVVDKESESCWWGFVADLKQRGLGGESLEVIVSDGNAGLLKAIQAHYPRVGHQRCTFHQAMSLAGHCEQSRHKRRIVQDALAVFAAQTQTEVRQRLHHFMQTWSDKEPKAVRNFLKGFDYCLTYLDYPEPWRRKLKTNNPIERTIEELNRRLIPMRSFNNTRSIERIVYGLVAYVLNQHQDVPNYQFTQNA
jgi:putative transposase